MTELERLRLLLDQGRVKLGVHIRRMNSPGSPVYIYAENVIPAAAILGGSFGATMLVHWYLGSVILLAGCAWWLLRVLPKVKDAVFDRTAALVLSSDAAFDLWWAKGTLSLYAQLADGTERAATRRDDWRAWVRAIPDDAAVQAPGHVMAEE